mmetsp:Transcript_5168/g.13385  ORF Transcript_5168/g.13385 Transcript_5168/m.13385 type:complete len:364 (-) Transcript_5168:150-1241(-)
MSADPNAAASAGSASPGDALPGARRPRCLVAIGGNALLRSAADLSVLEQAKRAGETAEQLLHLVEAGFDVVVTHGNGPQVGYSLLRNEAARAATHYDTPLDACVAETQGTIGYQIALALENRVERLHRKVVTVVTRVRVDAGDKAFGSPDKPIGPWMTGEEAAEHVAEGGKEWVVRELEKGAAKGWRRVVASPEPLEILERDAIANLVDAGFIVVAGGGGGIPVVHDESGVWRGVPAVVDKDRTSEILAAELRVDAFVLCTAVRKVARGFGTADEEWLDTVGAEEARKMLAAGEFGAGSMAPKIEAALAFLGGKGVREGARVVICTPEEMGEALAGRAGTAIVKEKGEEVGAAKKGAMAGVAL